MATDYPTTVVLDDVVAFVRRFVVMNEAQAIAAALFVAITHAIEAFDCTPYLHVRSAEKECGKTLLLELLELLVRQPLSTTNISDAALFRAIAELSPTILFDEVDTIYSAKARNREDLRGMLNAGYRRGPVVYRMGGKKMTTLEKFVVFCPKVLAGIGDLPDTIASRAIPIRLQRKTREERVDRFTRRDVEPEAESLRDRIGDWMEPQVDELRRARPALPEELRDRARDVWEPMLAIADLAGGDWPQRARAAAKALSGPQTREDDSPGVRVLADIRLVFAELGVDKIATAHLIVELCKIEESPWGDRFGKPITPQALSKLLKPFSIRTMAIWVEAEKHRGYKLEQFTDAWSRYLPPFTLEGGRTGRGGRSGSTIEAAPTTPTAPTALEPERSLLGDEMYSPVLADAVQNGHVTHAEAEKAYAVHQAAARAGEAAA